MKKIAFLLITVLVVSAGCGGDQGGESPDVASGDTAGTVPMDTTADEQAMSTTVQKINLNTAGEEEFKTIPQVGDRMAHEFEEYRPYVSIEQFRREIGKYVDEAQVTEYEKYVYVPIDPNESDAQTLMQIPGVDESEANELMEARPFDSTTRFLEVLSEYVEGDQLETAATYLESM